jgi:hypothetical protein
MRLYATTATGIAATVASLLVLTACSGEAIDTHSQRSTPATPSRSVSAEITALPTTPAEAEAVWKQAAARLVADGSGSYSWAVTAPDGPALVWDTGAFALRPTHRWFSDLEVRAPMRPYRVTSRHTRHFGRVEYVRSQRYGGRCWLVQPSTRDVDPFGSATTVAYVEQVAPLSVMALLAAHATAPGANGHLEGTLNGHVALVLVGFPKPTSLPGIRELDALDVPVTLHTTATNGISGMSLSGRQIEAVLPASIGLTDLARRVLRALSATIEVTDPGRDVTMEPPTADELATKRDGKLVSCAAAAS